MKIVVLHAYSSSNSGDGLLVTEALELIHSATDEAEILVLALDPESFQEYDSVRYRHPLTAQGTTPKNWALLGASMIALARGSRLPPAVRRAIAMADLVIAVGGGYMRGANPLESLKMFLVHVPQSDAARLNPSTIYLPQSVGPFRYLPTRFILSRLRKVSTYYVRDDRSLLALRESNGVRRAPDNALLALGDGVSAVRNDQPAQTVGLVARQLTSTRRREERYLESLRQLHDLTGAELLVQARARGNDDDAFYSRVFREGSRRTLIEGTESGPDRVGVVVSVRLHGAIQSIRNGVPAIHLSYERKGWGAYEDLGLAPYVHNAFDFDPRAVLEQADLLTASPAEYWDSVDAAMPRLRDAKSDILKAIDRAAQ